MRLTQLDRYESPQSFEWFLGASSTREGPPTITSHRQGAIIRRQQSMSDEKNACGWDCMGCVDEIASTIV
eukprot:5674209-Amphidinium_carterae.1